MLDLAGISPDLFGPSLLAIQHRHDLAFDVEPVTKEFFHEYGRILEEVEEAISGLGKDNDRKRLYTQRLVNRLMYIAFIQKKGWLKFNGDADCLAALWKAHRKDNSVSDKNFYRDRLKPLFFHGLNTTNEANRIGINRGGFRQTGLTRSVRDELNKLRRNNIIGQNLYKSLSTIYLRHNLRDLQGRTRNEAEAPIPRIMCSESMG